MAVPGRAGIYLMPYRPTCAFNVFSPVAYSLTTCLRERNVSSLHATSPALAANGSTRSAALMSLSGGGRGVTGGRVTAGRVDGAGDPASAEAGRALVGCGPFALRRNTHQGRRGAHQRVSSMIRPPYAEQTRVCCVYYAQQATAGTPDAERGPVG